MTTSIRKPRRRAQGFTLVELMVGMVISMLLVIVVISLYLAQQRSYNTQGDLAEVLGNSRAIAQLLQRQGRQAGYSDFTFLDNSFGVNETLEATNDTGVNASDTLTVRYFGSSPPGADPAAVPGTPTAPTPDGTMIAFTSGSPGAYDVSWVKVDGSGWGTIITNGWNPDWQR